MIKKGECTSECEYKNEARESKRTIETLISKIEALTLRISNITAKNKEKLSKEERLKLIKDIEESKILDDMHRKEEQFNIEKEELQKQIDISMQAREEEKKKFDDIISYRQADKQLQEKIREFTVVDKQVKAREIDNSKLEKANITLRCDIRKMIEAAKDLDSKIQDKRGELDKIKLEMREEKKPRKFPFRFKLSFDKYDKMAK